MSLDRNKYLFYITVLITALVSPSYSESNNKIINTLLDKQSYAAGAWLGKNLPGKRTQCKLERNGRLAVYQGFIKGIEDGIVMWNKLPENINPCKRYGLELSQKLTFLKLKYSKNLVILGFKEAILDRQHFMSQKEIAFHADHLLAMPYSYWNPCEVCSRELSVYLYHCTVNDKLKTWYPDWCNRVYQMTSELAYSRARWWCAKTHLRKYIQDRIKKERVKNITIPNKEIKLSACHVCMQRAINLHVNDRYKLNNYTGCYIDMFMEKARLWGIKDKFSIRELP